MAWAGVDRAVQTIEHHGLDGPVDRWQALREHVHAEVCAKGYDADRNTFTQYYGSRGVDAALLLLPRVGFLPWDDHLGGAHPTSASAQQQRLPTGPDAHRDGATA